VLPNGRFCSGVSSGKVSRHQLRRDTAYLCKNSLLVRYLFREGFLCASRHQSSPPINRRRVRHKAACVDLCSCENIQFEKSQLGRDFLTFPGSGTSPSLATYARMCVCSHPAVEQSSDVAFRNRGDESFLVENLSRYE
jgi:hypothetical protein